MTCWRKSELNAQRENKIYSAETPGWSPPFKIEITPIESEVIKEEQNWRYAAMIKTRQIWHPIPERSSNRLTVLASSFESFEYSDCQ
jgi:hypothetical protein